MPIVGVWECPSYASELYKTLQWKLKVSNDFNDFDILEYPVYCAVYTVLMKMEVK